MNVTVKNKNSPMFFLRERKCTIGIGLALSLLPLTCIALISRITGHEPITQITVVAILSVLVALPVLDFVL